MKRVVAALLLGLLAGSGGCEEPTGIRLQPAPEKPWVYPTDPPPVPDPARKRDKRRPPGPKKSGQCNADTPFGCL